MSADANMGMLQGEREWLGRVVEDLADDEVKLVYSDWLSDQGDQRGDFLRQYTAALGPMNADDFPDPNGLPEPWLDLIGFRIANGLAKAGQGEMKELLFQLARPALRLKPSDKKDISIPVGASKIGGRPDLPADMPWPEGQQCAAIYNDDTKGVTAPAGFVAQINLAEIAGTFAASVMPKQGVLSFFCYQDLEEDNPDQIGVGAFLLPTPDQLSRRKSPDELIDGNLEMPAKLLEFDETLDLPNGYDGPWSEELAPYKKAYSDFYDDDLYWSNFDNLLGYARSTTGGDPTPDKQTRHLIFLRTSADCGLHIQIHEDDLAKRNFDAIRLAWVDFD